MVTSYSVTASRVAPTPAALSSLICLAASALFRRLSVFAGGAPAEAMETVCQAAGPLAGELLDSLEGGPLGSDEEAQILSRDGGDESARN